MNGPIAFRGPEGTSARILVVFGKGSKAAGAGFLPDGRHTHTPDMRAWWPEMGIEAFRGQRFSHILCTASAREMLSIERVTEEIKAWCLRLEPMIWMDL